jgi:hypothetical protein
VGNHITITKLLYFPFPQVHKRVQVQRFYNPVSITHDQSLVLHPIPTNYLKFLSFPIAIVYSAFELQSEEQARILTCTSSGRYWCFMERSMARFRRWLRASTTSRGSRASASLMSRSWYGSYRSSYRSPAPTTAREEEPIRDAADKPS